MSEDKPKTVKEALKYLDAAITNAINFVESIEGDDINTMLKAFKLLDDQVKQLEEQTKILNKVLTKLDTERIPELFKSLEMDSVKIGGYNFILSNRLFASIPADKRAAGFAWLREHGYKEAIQETVNSNTLSSIVKNHIEETAQEPSDEVMTIHRKEYIQIRKA